MTPKALAEFRDQLPDCELVVYADIGSGTVLLRDGALRYPQEYLDALCSCAAQIFRGGPSYDGVALDPVLFFGPTGGRAFFQSSADPSAALCCIVGPDVDVASFLQAGRALMAAPEVTS